MSWPGTTRNQGGTSDKSLTCSAALRVRVNNGAATAGANYIRTSRLAEKAVVPVSSPWCEYWNGWVDSSVTASAGQEKGAGNAVPIAGAFVTGVTSAGQNQAGATLTPLTWFSAAAGVAGYAYKLDGTAGTAAEFTAAGGLLSGDGRTLTVPDGWYVRSDACAGLVLSGAYFVQWEEGAAAGLKYPTGLVPGGVSALGDLNKDAAARSGVFLLDWTTLSGVSAGTVVTGPVNIFGMSADGRKTVGVAGDSIFADNYDRDGGAVYGDSLGATTLAGRALHAAGYPFVRTAVSGTRASTPALYGGFAIRALMLRYCHAVITDMGHNDRGSDWNTLQGYVRNHWNKCRAAGVGGNARVIATTFCPQSNSTDLWATAGNQTSTMGAGSTGYDSYNPFLRAGVFYRSAGDPDAVFDLNGAIYSGAAANGATDVSGTLWPTNGVARAFNQDSTHPSRLTHTYVGAILRDQLPRLLGF